MRGLLLLLTLLAVPVSAHEVKLEQGAGQATILHLTYADGQPFAFEAYELYVPGQSTPAQVGRTNAGGQVIFLAGEQRQWRLKAFSADGHGIDTAVTVATLPSNPATEAAPALSRWSLGLAGLGLLLGLFGILQLLQRRNNS